MLPNEFYTSIIAIKISMHYSIFFLINFYFNLNIAITPSFEEQLPLWTWECISEKCVPFRVVDYHTKLQALETCNRLCASIQIWPQPTGIVSLSTTAVPIRGNLIRLQIVVTPSKIMNKHIEHAFKLMRNDLRLLEKKVRNFEEWRSLVVRVSMNGSVDPRMRLNTDESYKLTLHPTQETESYKISVDPTQETESSLVADVIAQSFCGVRHAFETLSQLIWLDPYRSALLILEAAKIEDAPKFNYRGLMIDTARRYYPVKELLRTIDAMGACKLNTLHWHASDSQAFSLRLRSVPELSYHGSLGPTVTYSINDIKSVIHRASLRGIRVIIEVDTPAHVGRAWSWGEAADFQTLVHCVDSEPWTTYCNEPPCGQLNPQNSHVYEILQRMYAEIIELTGVDDIFHIGGDDVSERCWEEHFNDTDSMTLWLMYTRSALGRLEIANGKLPNITLMWSSQLSDYIKTHLKEFTHSLSLQSRGVPWAHKYVRGLRNVISHEDAWDLNSGMGQWYEETDGTPYNSWQRVYEHRPWSRNAEWRVEGGEATVWSSSVGSGGLDGRAWPRAAALAERLWTDRPEGATRPVHARLDVFRMRLLERGIKASPIWSMWCTHNTYTCV